MVARVRSWIEAHRALAVVLFLALLVVSIVGLAGVALATDDPDFCSSCHEMTPYVAAWESGSHSEVTCVECHVDPGARAWTEHKIAALEQVRMHLFDEPSFPLLEQAHVPDERCTRCHKDIEDSQGFSHDEHARQGACVGCHQKTGHAVTDADLITAGVFDSAAAASRRVTALAVSGRGVDNIQGHLDTDCADCHDMAATGCEKCHEPRHEVEAFDCMTCHEPGPEWLFLHPTDGACTDCHDRPEGHTTTAPGSGCEICHGPSYAEWKYTHPADDECEACHARPDEHRSGACTSCHGVGESWGFVHPASSSSCTSCHGRPANHSTASCTSCHKTGASWAFSHPGSGSSCTSCHRRPSGHSSSSCTSCHGVGSSWAFRHPSSSSCASCHGAPSGHYGSSCASCHSPSRSWSSATFRHPSVREHSYKSFACSKCHPSGYSSASCTGCHGPGGHDDDDGDDDDDDEEDEEDD